jgi:peroxiredoxin
MTPPFAFDRIVDMLSPWYMPGQEEAFYTFAGDDSVVVDDQTIPCEMWVFAPDSTVATRIWLDPSRHVVLKSEAAVRLTPGEVMTAEMTVMRLKIDHDLQPEDFVFAALEGYTRVASTNKLYVHDSLEGQVPADFALTDLAGGPVDTRNWRGKVVLLDYFGTHCPPCVKEFGHLADLRAEYGDDVVMVGVTSDDARKVARFVQRYEVTLPVWLDVRGEVRDAYRVESIPALYILDGTGTVREHFVGLQTPETLREALRNLGVSARN